MAKKRTAKPAAPKGFSAAKLFVLAVVCFFVSKLFANKVAFLDYGLAIVGFALFGLSLWKFRKSRGR